MGRQCWNFLKGKIYAVFAFFFHCIGKELTEERFCSILQFIKFGMIGLSNSVVYYIVYYISIILIRNLEFVFKWDYLAAQVLAYIVSVAWSFVWNSKYVFKVEKGSERNWVHALIKTYLSYSFTGLFLNSVLLVFWIDLIGLSEFIAPIINQVINVPINFLINKFWAFKTKKK